jgi:hypothetical protein
MSRELSFGQHLQGCGLFRLEQATCHEELLKGAGAATVLRRLLEGGVESFGGKEVCSDGKEAEKGIEGGCGLWHGWPLMLRKVSSPGGPAEE